MQLSSDGTTSSTKETVSSSRCRCLRRQIAGCVNHSRERERVPRPRRPASEGAIARSRNTLRTESRPLRARSRNTLAFLRIERAPMAFTTRAPFTSPSHLRSWPHLAYSKTSISRSVLTSFESSSWHTFAEYSSFPYFPCCFLTVFVA